MNFTSISADNYGCQFCLEKVGAVEGVKAWRSTPDIVRPLPALSCTLQHLPFQTELAIALAHCGGEDEPRIGQGLGQELSVITYYSCAP